MVNSAYGKDFFREIRRTFNRFLSITLLLLLAAGFFSGIRATQPDMQISADRYMDETALFDLRVVSTQGVTAADAEILGDLDGVNRAVPGYSLDAVVAAGEDTAIVKLHDLSETMNVPELVSGRLPQAVGECAAEQALLTALDLQVGDTVTVAQLAEGMEGALKTDTLTITGVVRSPLYMTKISHGTSALGSGSVAAFVILPPETFDLDYFTDLYLSVDGAAALMAYDDAYGDRIGPVQTAVEDLAPAREQARYEELTAPAREEIDRAQEELDDAGEKLADGQAELDRAKQDYADGVSALEQARQDLADARAAYDQNYDNAYYELEQARLTLVSRQAQLDDGRAALEQGRGELEAQAAQGRAQLDETAAQLSQQAEQLAAGQAAYETALAQYEAQQAQWDALPPEQQSALPETEQLLQQTQTHFYALDMTHTGSDFKVDEGFNILKLKVKEAENDGSLTGIASTYDVSNEILRDSVDGDGRKVITFNGVLKHGVMPLPELLQMAMKYGVEAMRRPVEIEFACNLEGDKASFYLLQIRPIVDSKQMLEEDLSTIPDEQCLMRSDNSLGHGAVEDVCDVIYVKAGDDFSAANNQLIAEEIERFNRHFLDEGKGYVLVGPGRWGSSDPWLGVPVRWPQISAARVIAEIALKNYRIDPSQGTHFFQNLTSLGVGYFTIEWNDAAERRSFFRKDVLDQMPAVSETEYVRHVLFPQPLRILMDGKKQEGVVVLV